MIWGKVVTARVWIIDKCKKKKKKEERVVAISYLYIPVKRRGCVRDATAARIARSEPEESPADDVPM